MKSYGNRALRALAAAAVILAPSELFAQECRSLAVEDPPSWLTSGTYVVATRQVHLVGARDPKLHSYELTDEGLSVIPSSLDARTTPLANSFPVSIKPTKSGFLISMTRGVALEVGADFAVKGSMKLTEESRGVPSGLGSVYEWLPVRESGLIGVGSVRNVPRNLSDSKEQPFRVGLFIATRTSTGISNGRLLFEVGPNDYYLMGLTTLAAKDDVAYFLDLSSAPEVKTIDTRKGSLAGNLPVPKGFEQVPRLSVRSDGPEAVPIIMKEIEQATMPAGIYWLRGQLQVLTRRPALGPGGGVVWELHAFDFSTNSYRPAVKLPTNSPHLLVLGEDSDSLLVVEKGSVVRWGEQPVGNLLLIPWARLGATESQTLTCKVSR